MKVNRSPPTYQLNGGRSSQKTPRGVYPVRMPYSNQMPSPQSAYNFYPVTAFSKQRHSESREQSQRIKDYSSNNQSLSQPKIDDIDIKYARLNEKLKNIHLFYKSRVEEQRKVSTQRNEIFISMIQQNQRIHNEKIKILKKKIEQTRSEQNINGNESIHEQMYDIDGSLSELISQTAELKQSQAQLMKKIKYKQQITKQKQQQLQKQKLQLQECSKEIQQFQNKSLKQEYRNKQLAHLIQKAFHKNKQN